MLLEQRAARLSALLVAISEMLSSVESSDRQLERTQVLCSLAEEMGIDLLNKIREQEASSDS